MKHRDVGSVSVSLCMDLTANTEGAKISFGSDGIIRGTGVYSRNSKEFLIGAETIFGDGRDGDLRISSMVHQYRFGIILLIRLHLRILHQWKCNICHIW